MSELAQQLSVDSVTGIDVTLPLAGAGVRSYAFVADWHVRFVLALAWYGVGALLYNGRASLSPPLTNEPLWFGLVVVPAAAIYFLYHPILEVLMHGSTPGKRMAGVRIVTRDGGAPSVGALLVRNVFRLVDSLPVAYAVGLALVVLTRENVRCGDLAAGTLLVYERAGAALVAPPAAAAAGTLDVATAELVTELLARWPRLTVEARAALTRELLRRLGRPPQELERMDDAALREALENLTRAPEPRA